MQYTCAFEDSKLMTCHLDQNEKAFSSWPIWRHHSVLKKTYAGQFLSKPLGRRASDQCRLQGRLIAALSAVRDRLGHHPQPPPLMKLTSQMLNPELCKNPSTYHRDRSTQVFLRRAENPGETVEPMERSGADWIGTCSKKGLRGVLHESYSLSS